MSKSQRRVGIDWGSESHQVCRLDGEEAPKQRSFPHTGEGLKALVEFVAGGEIDCEQIVFAIEVNHGAVVEALLAKGLRIHPINPKLLDRLRDRFSLAGAKDDRRDAFVLASCVESDAHAFRKIEAGNEENSRLRAATRLREELKSERRANTNRLWNELRGVAQLRFAVFRARRRLRSAHDQRRRESLPPKRGVWGLSTCSLAACGPQLGERAARRRRGHRRRPFPRPSSAQGDIHQRGASGNNQEEKTENRNQKFP